jgi:hypothetical protein
MCTQYLPHVYPPTLFPNILLPLIVTNPPTGGSCSTFLLSHFVKGKKNNIFVYLRYLYMKFPCDISIYIHIITQISPSPLFFLLFIYLLLLCWVVVHCGIYKVSYNISSFYLSPLLMVISTILKFYIHFLYREYINHVHLLNFLLLPSPSHM